MFGDRGDEFVSFAMEFGLDQLVLQLCYVQHGAPTSRPPVAWERCGGCQELVSPKIQTPTKLSLKHVPCTVPDLIGRTEASAGRVRVSLTGGTTPQMEVLFKNLEPR